MPYTAAQSGKLALCSLFGGLLCQEGCIGHQMRAFTTLKTRHSGAFSTELDSVQPHRSDGLR